MSTEKPDGGQPLSGLEDPLVDATVLRMLLQVAPFAPCGHTAAGGSFTVLRFEERDLPDVVCTASRDFIEQVAQETLGKRRDDQRRGGRDG
jgi:hypothetical protein